MDPHKKSLDPYRNNPDWLLCKALATLLLYRVLDRIKLESAQSKLLDSRQRLLDARSRVRMTLVEHKRAK